MSISDMLAADIIFVGQAAIPNKVYPIPYAHSIGCSSGYKAIFKLIRIIYIPLFSRPIFT